MNNARRHAREAKQKLIIVVCKFLNCYPPSSSFFSYLLRTTQKKGSLLSRYDSDWRHLLILGTLQSDIKRRLPWKRRWKIDFASFQSISRLSQVAQLLERREFMLQLKRGDCARVQTEMVEFFAMPFPFSSKLEIWSFQVVVLQRRQRNLQTKRDANLGTRLAWCMCRVVILLMKPIAFFDVAVAVAVAIAIAIVVS